MRQIVYDYRNITLEAVKEDVQRNDTAVDFLLYNAVVENRDDIVSWLMSSENRDKTKMCLHINDLWDAGWGEKTSLIYFAARNGNLSCVQLLIENGANPAVRGYPFESPLKAAAKNSRHTIVEYLVQLIQENGREELKAQVLSTMDVQGDHRDASVAFFIAQQGWTDILRQLDKLGVDLNKECYEGRPLAAAAGAGKVQTVEFLLQGYSKCAEVISTVNHRCAYANSTAVFKSASGDSAEHLQCLKILVEVGANLGLANRENVTPLMVALGGNQDAAHFILGKLESDVTRSQIVATVNNRDKKQKSALHLAAEKGDARIVEQLVGEGAFVDLPDLEGQTPLFLAVKSSNQAAVQRVIAAKAHFSKKINNINQRTVAGYTAVMQAVASNCLEILQLLTSKGADLTIADNEGITPLLLAVRKKHYDIIKFLLQQEAVKSQINLQFPPSMTTVVHEAVADSTIMNFLSELEEKSEGEPEEELGQEKSIRQEVNYGLQDAEGYTPLMRAVVAGSDDAVTFLLKQSTAVSTIDVQSMKGETAAHLVILHKQNALIGLAQLADAKANFGIIDFNGKTPLWYAAELGLPSVVSFLLTDSRVKSSVIATANNEVGGCNIVYWLVWNTSSEVFLQVMTILVQAPEILIEKPCYDLATPVWQAVQSSKNGYLQQLLRSDIPRAESVRRTFNIAWTTSGVTPVFAAIKEAQKKLSKEKDHTDSIFCLSLLINAGADLSIPDKDAQTPLVWSFANADDQITELLLKAAEQGNHTLKETLDTPQITGDKFLYMTAFYIAVKKECLTWAVCLLKQGAHLSYPGAEKLLNTLLEERVKEKQDAEQKKLEKMIALLLLGCTVPLERDLEIIYKFKRPITQQISKLVTGVDEKNSENLLHGQELQCRKFFRLLEVNTDSAPEVTEDAVALHKPLKDKFYQGWFFGMGAHLDDKRSCVYALRQCDIMLQRQLKTELEKESPEDGSPGSRAGDHEMTVIIGLPTS